MIFYLTTTTTTVFTYVILKISTIKEQKYVLYLNQSQLSKGKLHVDFIHDLKTYNVLKKKMHRCQVVFNCFGQNNT